MYFFCKYNTEILSSWKSKTKDRASEVQKPKIRYTGIGFAIFFATFA